MFRSRSFLQDDQSGMRKAFTDDELTKSSIGGDENATVAGGRGENLAISGIGWPRCDHIDIVAFGDQACSELRREAVIDQQLHW